MAEYIEREVAKKAIFDYILEDTVSKHPSSELCRASRMGAEGAMYELDYVPSADVVEVRHGEWIEEKVQVENYGCIDNEIFYKCSLCGRYEERKEPYCNCGAKMNGKGDTNE